MSQTALAKAIAVAPRHINEIVLGKRAITADTDCGWPAMGACPAASGFAFRSATT